MTPLSLLLSIQILLTFFFTTVHCNSECISNRQCCLFVEGFPHKLKKLRENYRGIQDFYEANDDLDKALLGESVEDSFKTPFACYTMNSILGFYLDTVLPTALAGVQTRDLQRHVESIQLIFNQLKTDVTKCRHFFSCKEHFDIKTINSTYTQMASKGLYKAMGELNLLFNHFETYLASTRHRHQIASH